jgi:hemerythrin superfamily protein
MTTAVEFIRDQHDEIRRLFGEVEGSEEGARKEPAECLIRLLAVHETAEELVIYPALETIGEEGRRVADERRAEEDVAKREVSDLEKLGPESPDFEMQFGKVKALVLTHAEREEATVLPLLEAHKDDEELQRLAAALDVAIAMAPTHPHPHSPESALGNLVTGPFVAVADRVRDALKSVVS